MVQVIEKIENGEVSHLALRNLVELENIGEVMQRLRIGGYDGTDYSTSEFAEMVGLSLSGYEKLENPGEKKVRLKTLGGICRGLNVDYRIEGKRIRFFKKENADFENRHKAESKSDVNNVRAPEGNTYADDLHGSLPEPLYKRYLNLPPGKREAFRISWRIIIELLEDNNNDVEGDNPVKRRNNNEDG